MKSPNFFNRSHHTGDISETLVGKEVTLCGWCHNRRDHGGFIFVDLRDRSGLVQVTIDPETLPKAKNLRSEWVIRVKGMVHVRPEGMTNPNMKSGTVEVKVSELDILSESEPLPFQIEDDKVGESLRLKYRYLDLRSKNLHHNLRIRHEVSQEVRAFLNEGEFYEIETPMLYKSTPEGARDYVVPSRVHPGSFYALPQSPQTLKQLLMVAGYEKYYQIVKCFRDEDLRADRQPEFTQIDIEMSFVDQGDVMQMNENLARRLWKKFKNKDIGEIPIISYEDAMASYGSDKPDLRIPIQIQNVSSVFESVDFKVTQSVLKSGGQVLALGFESDEAWSRSRTDQLTKFVGQYGAKGLMYFVRKGEEVKSPVSKFLTEDQIKTLFKSCDVSSDGVVFLIASEKRIAQTALGALRVHLNEAQPERWKTFEKDDAFCWVSDMPLLEYDVKEERWFSCHHPFTSPSDEALKVIHEALKAAPEFGTSDLGKIAAGLKAKAYDFVCNGYEIAGGSIRIHNQQIQKSIFELLNLSEKEQQEKFGFFLEGLKYGTPPHGGIAWGLDRLVMILCGATAIRDVIAFPKTAKASCLMSEAPNPISIDQLIELSLKVNKPANTSDL